MAVSRATRRFLVSGLLPAALIVAAGGPPGRGITPQDAAAGAGPSRLGAPLPPADASAEHHLLLGHQHAAANRMDAAVAAWERALAAYRARGDAAGVAHTLEQLGFGYGSLRRPADALTAYREALTLVRRPGADGRREGHLLADLADVWFELGDLAEAQRAAAAGLPLLRREGPSERQWLLQQRLSAIASGQQRRQAAIDHLSLALALARRLGDPLLQEISLDGLSALYLQEADYPRVIEHLLPSLQLKDLHGRQDEKARLLQMLGFSYYWLNDYGRAIDAYEEALRLERSDPAQDRDLIRLLLHGLGDVYFYVGNSQRSGDYYRQSLELAKTLGKVSSQAVAWVSLGQLASQQDQPLKAREAFLQGLQLARRGGLANLEANALAGLGHSALDGGERERAEQHFEQALAIYRRIGNRYNEAVMLRALAQVELMRENPAAAVGRLRRSLTISRSDEDLHGQAQALTLLGVALSRDGRQRAAEEMLREAIAVQETIRGKLGHDDALKVSLFDTQATPYQALQAVLALQGRAAESLEIAERARARAFVELLQAPRGGSTGRLPPAIEDGGFAQQPINAARIQALARELQVTLVQYSFVGARLFIWTVSPDGVIESVAVELPDALPGLRHTVASRRGGRPSLRSGSDPDTLPPSRPASLSSGRERSRRSLRELHQLLIGPIASRLPRDPEAPVIFFPQGPLFFVPFAALEDGNGRALVDHHTILTAPSIEVIELLAERRPPAERWQLPLAGAVLVAGNPTMPEITLGPGDAPRALPPLPGAEREAREIARLFGSAALIGAAASEAAIAQRLPEARIVHLATHGLLDDVGGWGIPGAIALAPSPGEDGLLTSHDILNLRLQADLVVLSACDTGRGRITGDGVIGLSRSLLTAGSRHVLVSLWAVPDAPTTLLMTEFYRRLVAGEGLAQALRQAMLQARSMDPDPVSWAAFTLIGPPR